MVSVNLIPQATRSAQARRRYLKAWGVLILASAAVAAVPLVTDWSRRVEAADLHRRNDRLQAGLTALRADLEVVTTQAHQALIQLERAKALHAKRAWSAMLAMITGRMPRGCWLRSIATDPNAPRKTSGRRPPDPYAVAREAAAGGPNPEGHAPRVIIEAPRRLMVAGYATDAAEPHQFVTNLKDTGVFTDVVLEHCRIEPALDGLYFRFELVCEW